MVVVCMPLMCCIRYLTLFINHQTLPSCLQRLAALKHNDAKCHLKSDLAGCFVHLEYLMKKYSHEGFYLKEFQGEHFTY